MAAITTRQTAGTGATVKNLPLTNAEVDTNFINLNVDVLSRVSKSGDTVTGTLNIRSTQGFVSPNATKTITATMLDSGQLSWSGSSGQLFSITDSLTGTLFSVNDVSGIPSIEVLDTGLVKIAQYNGNTLFGTGVDNATDKVQVVGTASIVANSTGTALRITQTGTGDALRVEDSANPDSSPFIITSDGNVGILGSAVTFTNTNLRINKPITGSVNSNQVYVNGQIQSDVTGASAYFRTQANQATGFTNTTLVHYTADQGTLSGTVTNQIGFLAESSMTGAANNFGFYSNISAGANRWNFYALGTADNYFGGPTVISVNSSSEALRITQTGTGDALRVEDSANPDITPFRIGNDGLVLVGGTPVVGGGNAYPLFQITGYGDGTIGANAAAMAINGFLPSGAGGFFGFNRSNSATVGTNTIVANGDQIGRITWSGADGTNYIRSAQISAEVDGIPGTNDMPGRLVFSTTADNASTPTERVRIDNAGNVGIGDTSPSTRGRLSVLATTGAGRQFVVTSAGLTQARYDDNSLASPLTLQNHGMTAANQGAAILWTLGNSDANSQNAAAIKVLAEGTWDATTASRDSAMVFSTTLDGNLTDRVRIDSAGRVGFGGSPYAGTHYYFANNITGATSVDTILHAGTVQSGVTSAANIFTSFTGTAASSFTLSNLRHFIAEQATFGSGSIVTNQSGFNAGSSLIGATNNFGFLSNIPDGVTRTITTVARTTNVVTITTSVAHGYTTGQSVIIAATTNTSLNGTFTITGTPTTTTFTYNQTAANIASVADTGSTKVAGRWNFYAAGTADNYINTRLLLGRLYSSNERIGIGGSTSAAGESGIFNDVTVGSATTVYTAFNSYLSTAAASFTLGNLTHYKADQFIIGAGSTITNQYGFFVANLTGGTNNFGFHSNVASGTGRWNFYAAGTAANYFAGTVTIAATTASTSTTTGALVVSGGVGIAGALNATTKSFIIDHPTKPGKLLKHGSLEGPEFGVYVRGRLKDTNMIVLPEYWTKLVDPSTITVNLTPIGSHQELYVEDIVDGAVFVKNSNLFNKTINCFYTVFAERRDVDKLEVEVD